MPAELFFLDVGEGTCNIVLLGERRAIVIDTGPRQAARVPVQLLDRYVDRISALIISHNDADHCGAAQRIVEGYPKAVERVAYLLDRPVEDIPFYGLIQHEIKVGNLDPKAVFRLERCNEPLKLFEDAASNIELALFAPTFVQNQAALSGIGPNSTSALIMLHCGSRRVFFPGDTELPAWRDVAAELGAPVRCDIMAAPHHGGRIASRGRSGRRGMGVDDENSADIEWLYSRATQARYIVISVGTTNTHKHPLPAQVRAMRGGGATVLCTQITRQCCNDLESCRPGILAPHQSNVPAMSSAITDRTGAGNSRNVACAGSIVAELTPDTVRVHRVDEHQRAVDALCASARAPLCRR